MLRLFGWVAIAAVFAFFSGAAVIVLGAAVMWLFVFGDDPWPGYSGALLGGAALVVGLSIFAGSLALGVRSGHLRRKAR